MRLSSVFYVALVLPFVAVAAGASVAADHAGSLAAARLSSLGRWLSAAEAKAEPSTWQELAIAPVDVISGDAPPDAPRADSSGRRATKRRGAPKAAAPRAIRVSRETVLRLANSGARPRGIPVEAKGRRPAGILLTSVSGLGIGLQDGDVLVEAMGKPARDVGAVIAAVLAARSARTAELSGRFWRHGELWLLVVEQPYLQGPGPENSAQKGRR